MFQNLKAKIHKAKENGLTTLLRYVTCPKSMNYEIILTIIVSNSLKFELVQFFFDQTLLWCRMCRMSGAECAECGVFLGKLALLKLKWTECAECWNILVFDYYFGAECTDCRVQNVQNIGCRMCRMLGISRKTCIFKF